MLNISYSRSMWSGCRRRRGRGRVPGWLDRGCRHSVFGHYRGPGDGLQRLVQGEAVPWAAEPHRAGAKVYRHPQGTGHPDPCGWDCGGRHRSDQIRYETGDARLQLQTCDANIYITFMSCNCTFFFEHQCIYLKNVSDDMKNNPAGVQGTELIHSHWHTIRSPHLSSYRDTCSSSILHGWKFQPTLICSCATPSTLLGKFSTWLWNIIEVSDWCWMIRSGS